MELEISGEVIVMSILPANFTGQQNLDGIKKVTTVPGSPGNNTSGGNNGTIVDPDAKPIVKNLELHGRLQVGDTIRGEYAFGANKGDPVDHSVYTWYRIKGKPSPDKLKIVPDEENKEKILGPIAVTDNGKVPLYTLQKSEMEHFIRLEVQPMHGGQPLGDKLVVTTNIDKEDNGNKNLSGGSDSYGRVIDPDLGPEISDLKIGIEVEGDKKYLTATYQFKPKQGADDEDKSRFLWGEYAVGDEFTTRRDVSRVGRTVEKNQAVAAQPHKVPRYEKPLDELSGKIIALSVQGKNRSNMDGNTEDADTKKDAKELGDNVNTDGVIKGKADVIEAKMNKTEAKARVNLLNKDQPLSDEESARLTIKTTKGGANIGGVPVSIEMTYEVRTPNNLNHKDFPDSDRPKVTAKLEVEDKKGVLYDNPNIQDRKITYTGHTDENGDLIIKVTDPDGKGVKTKINVTTGGAPDENLDITFTVITSPNVDGATYYGHMENTITTENGLVFHRPTIKKEHLGTVDVSSPVVDGEIWTYHRYTKVMGYCTERGLQTPSTSEYLDLAKESNEKFGVEKNAVKRKYGWPTKYEYYASNIVPQGEPGAGYRRTVDLEILTVGRNNNSQLVACRNP
ncbi:putative invasin [Xenorhabdus mauleonii]|uniref:Invasin n=1 Tax=Xenorhabdus mauleonii TaxID=351675 RepID=A0A2G0NTI0_9GAMM|nr:putative invasin [Xenorhabdus mauleonii]